MIDIQKLIEQIKQMNTAWGSGTVTLVSFDLMNSDFTDSNLETLVGFVVTSNPGDSRMFKVQRGFLTFLSHRRKLT